MKTVLIIFLNLFIVLINAQSSAFAWPIDSTLKISGNYGELRPNHFHTGLDLSTNNRLNLPVRAALDGYVSRIRISATGYGKCVYITHANGKVTVYAHLNSFSNAIETAVMKEIQKQKVYEIDFYPEPNTILYKKNEVIGRSGNTGGSQGPHLHFEIRDELTEVPFNPVLYYAIKDVNAPEAFGILWLDASDSLALRHLKRQNISAASQKLKRINMGSLESTSAIIALSYHAADRINSIGSLNQVAAAELTLDGRSIYKHNFRGLHFENGRFVNEFVEFAGHTKFQKCIVPENPPPGIFEEVSNRGRIILGDTLWHYWTLTLKDEQGNSRELFGQLRTKVNPQFAKSECTQIQMMPQVSNAILLPGGRLQTDSNSTYNTACINLIGKIEDGASFKLSPSNLTLNNAILLVTPIPKKFSNKTEKVVLRNDKNYYVPSLKNDSLYFDIKSLGIFFWQLDLEAPLLRAIFPKGKQGMTKELRFFLSDMKSGIGEFNLYLNDQWTWAYYDSKNDVLVFEIDSKIPRGLLNFRLEVKDKCGNRANLNASYFN